jgi:hypothetical protein
VRKLWLEAGTRQATDQLNSGLPVSGRYFIRKVLPKTYTMARGSFSEAPCANLKVTWNSEYESSQGRNKR